MSTQSRTAPKAIKLAAGNNTLTIQWADGHVSVYAYQYLRDNCPCATCTDGSGSRRTGAISPPTPFPILGAKPLRPERAELVGRYALRFYWSDEHSSGIYGFERLRDLCECGQCAPDQAGG